MRDECGLEGGSGQRTKRQTASDGPVLPEVCRIFFSLLILPELQAYRKIPRIEQRTCFSLLIHVLRVCVCVPELYENRLQLGYSLPPKALMV